MMLMNLYKTKKTGPAIGRLWLNAMAVFGLLFVLCSPAPARENAEAMVESGGTPREEEFVVEVKGVTGAKLGPKVDTMARPEILSVEEYQRNISSLVEMLEGVPGVSVIESGGVEGPWYLMVRGTGGTRTAVYLDGILLNSPMGGPVDLSRIPMSHVDEVVVYRGAPPPGYPVSGISGVVDIKTMDADGSSGASGKLSADSLSTVSVSARITNSVMNGRGLIGTAHQWGPGRYQYNDDQGTYRAHGDDREEQRSNNAFADHDLILKWDRKIGDYSAYAAGYYQERNHEVPGMGRMETDRASEKTQLRLAYAGLRRPGVISPDLDAEVRIHILQEKLMFKDEDGEIGMPRDDIDLRNRVGLDFYFYYYGLSDHRISTYLGLYNDEYFPESEIDPLVEKISYLRSSVYLTVADEINLIEGRFKLEPRLRYIYEGNQYSGPTLVEQLGEADDTTAFGTMSADLSISFLLAEGLWLVAHTGQYYRPPAFLEEFGDRTILVGNAELSPERSLNQEMGLVYSPGPMAGFDDLQAEVLVYENNLNQMIGWVNLPGGNLVADNVGDARMSGLEVSVRLNRRDLLVDASYAFQDTVNISDNKLFDGNRLSGVPMNKAHLGAAYVLSSGRLFYEIDYQDIRYLDEANNVSAKPRLIHNLGVVYNRGRYSMGVKAINLGNDTSREALGYPVPGAHYKIFMEVKE